MRSFFRALVSTILLSATVITCLAFPVSADTTETIEFDSKLHVERTCNGCTEYKLNVVQSTAYGIRIRTTSESVPDNVGISKVFNSGYFPHCRIFGKTGELTLRAFEKYKPGAYLQTYSQCYLEKGEYTFVIESNYVCSVVIDGFDGEFYITKDGQRIDCDLYGSTYVLTSLYEEKGHKYEAVIKPGNRNQGNRVWIQTGKSGYLIENVPLKETITVPLEMDKEYYFDSFCDGYEDNLGYYFMISSGKKEGFKVDKNDNILDDGHTQNIVYFTCDNKDNIRPKDVANNKNVFPGIDAFGVEYDYPNVLLGEIYGNDEFATRYYFIKDTSSKNVLSLNKDYTVAPALFTDKTMDAQVVYSFTPPKDSTYSLTSTGKDANPYVAIFDSNDKCIGWYDNNINATDVGINVFGNYEIDYHLNMKVDLKAGQTYYFYFTNSYRIDHDFNHPEFKVAMPFNVKLTDTSAAPAPVTEGTFEDFVERLYVVALERPSEPEGKAFWCEKVQDGTYDGAYCARFFLTSPEFLGKNKIDEQFVDTLYRTFFNREADDEGRAFWIKKIKESSKETVIEGFINSTEWCNICASYGVKSGAQWAKATVASANATAFAERLYTECLGRPAEEGGLKYWSLSLTNLERTGSQAAKEFFYSEEFLGKNFGNEEYVMRLYGTFMGRTPEEEGKAYWINFLNNGGSRDEVFNFFSSCPEFTEICTKYAIDR